MSAMAAFVLRDWRTTRSYRLNFGVDIAATGFFLVFFFFLARLVDSAGAGPAAPAGPISPMRGLPHGYFAYALVGIALTKVMHAGLNSFSSRIRGEQTSGTLEAVLAAPVSPRAVIVGSGLYDLLAATFSAVATVVVGAVFFGFRPPIGSVGPASVGAAILALAACVGMFSALGIGLAASTMVFKQTSALAGMATAAIALVGGAYFPVDVFPAPLQATARVFPPTWAFDLARQALVEGRIDAPKLGLTLAWVALTLPAALALFAGATRRARRQGTLTHY